MKIHILSMIISATLFLPSAVTAAGESNFCATKYPVILAHGMFATDHMLGFIDYWWGIEDALKNEGAEVYATKINCMDPLYKKACQFRAELRRVMAISGKQKCNIIAHSHGGVYARSAISNFPDVREQVVSLTTVCTPHRGSAVAEAIVGIIPNSLEWLAGAIVDFVYVFVFGDTKPGSVDMCRELTREYMKNVFNPNTPDAPEILYQSIATKIKTLTPDLVLGPTWLFLKIFEGENDGLVSTTSAAWGNFLRVESGAWWCGGVSHINAVNHFFGMTPGFDAEGMYVGIVRDLRKRGM